MNIEEIIKEIKRTGNYTTHILDALEMALEQRDFWHDEYLKLHGTPNDGGEQRNEDDYQIEIILKDAVQLS